MTHISRTWDEHSGNQPDSREGMDAPRSRPRRSWRTIAAGVAIAAALGGVVFESDRTSTPAAYPHPMAHVTVSQPLRAPVAVTTDFLGQFSAVDTVELRAQVGGTLTSIGFRDGQIVHKGDVLFTIDPRPYAVRLEQANANLESAQAHQELTRAEYWRAQQLRQTNFSSAETLDQRAADQHAAEATTIDAHASIDDAKLDLEFARLIAPFTGRIGAHQVSIGNLVSGSRAGSSPTTLLATLVSLDPIHLDFDMSEADYLAWRAANPDPEARGDVAISVGDNDRFTRHGTLDFIDNAVDRSSGTIHARATVPNADLLLTPGQFARLRLVISPPKPVLLVPASAIVPDQSRQTVMVVKPDNTVAPRQVTTGGLHEGLRIITAGLSPDDRVIIDGLMQAQPGAKVQADTGRIVAQAGQE